MIIDELSNLPLPVQSTDELPIERGELAYKVTYNNLVGSEIAGVKSNITTLQGNVTTLQNADSKIESSIAIIVNGDTASMAVPVGGYAYIKGNTHGLADGLYTNTSAAAFPASGGTADSTVFTAVSGGGLNTINNRVDNIGTITNYIYNGVDATWAGQSYNNIFENIPVGKYIIQISYVSDFNSIACTGNSFNNTFADLGNRGGTFILDAQSTTTVQLYINTNDTNNHIFYRFYGKLMKIA